MLENRTLESELTEQVKEAQPDEITEVPPMTPEEIAETQDRIIEKVENGEIVLTTDREKGNFGEMKTDQEMRKKGYERISGGAVRCYRAFRQPKEIPDPPSGPSAQCGCVPTGQSVGTAALKRTWSSGRGSDLSYELGTASGSGAVLCNTEEKY